MPFDGTQETPSSREDLHRLRSPFPLAKKVGKMLGIRQVLQ